MESGPAADLPQISDYRIAGRGKYLPTGVIYYVGFLLDGAPYPLFFAILGAIFNIVPFIGAVLAGLFPLLMALLTGSLFNIVGITVIALGNHLFESNFLTPKIVGAKVRLNPLFTVLTVVIGDMVWGIAGMILFIPLLGVIKIICDSVESLRPYGLLIGDEGENEKKGTRPIESEYRSKDVKPDPCQSQKPPPAHREFLPVGHPAPSPASARRSTRLPR